MWLDNFPLDFPSKLRMYVKAKPQKHNIISLHTSQRSKIILKKFKDLDMDLFLFFFIT